jgi:hypothetical protein
MRRQSPQWIHVGTLAEQVDRHKGLGARRDRRCDGIRIEIECLRFNIDEDGLRTGSDNAAGRGEERIRCRNDFVAGLQVQGHQGEQQGIRA